MTILFMCKCYLTSAKVNTKLFQLFVSCAHVCLDFTEVFDCKRQNRFPMAKSFRLSFVLGHSGCTNTIRLWELNQWRAPFTWNIPRNFMTIYIIISNHNGVLQFFMHSVDLCCVKFYGKLACHRNVMIFVFFFLIPKWYFCCGINKLKNYSWKYPRTWTAHFWLLTSMLMVSRLRRIFFSV